MVNILNKKRRLKDIKKIKQYDASGHITYHTACGLINCYMDIKS